MGNTCSYVHNNGNRAHHPIKPNLCVPQNQTIRTRALPGNRQGNPVRSAVPDVQSQSILTTLNEIQKAHTQEQDVVPLIFAATVKIQKADTKQAEKVMPAMIVVKENINEKQLAPATVAATENIQKADMEEELAQATTAGTNRKDTEEHVIAPTTTAATAGINREDTGEQEIALATTAVSADIQRVNTEEQDVAPATTAVPASTNSDDTEEHEIALVTTTATAGINREDIEEQQIAPEPSAITADIQRVDTEEQEVAPASTLASENLVEGNNRFRSNEDIGTSSGSNLGPDDACKESKSSNLPFLPVIEDNDECPTCLEGYNTENPKIITRCRHHYHLGCIYEWMERSATCPMCSEVMEFDEDS